MPVLPRDEIDMDDADSAAEDHVGEATVSAAEQGAGSGAKADVRGWPARIKMVETDRVRVCFPCPHIRDCLSGIGCYIQSAGAVEYESKCQVRG